jgi:hypothetical protein
LLFDEIVSYSDSTRKEETIGYMNLVKSIPAQKLNLVTGPELKPYRYQVKDKQNKAFSALSYVISVDNQGDECLVPETILHGVHFIEGCKEESLHKNCEKEVLVEHEPGHYDKAPLRDESGHSEPIGFHLIVELVDQQPVNREVVAVVFPDEVVQIRLVEELIAIDPVKEAG